MTPSSPSRSKYTMETGTVEVEAQSMLSEAKAKASLPECFRAHVVADALIKEGGQIEKLRLQAETLAEAPEGFQAHALADVERDKLRLEDEVQEMVRTELEQLRQRYESNSGTVSASCSHPNLRINKNLQANIGTGVIGSVL